MRSPICERCNLPHPPLVECVVAQAQAMNKLLLLIGDVGACTKCNATVYWVRGGYGPRRLYRGKCAIAIELRKLGLSLPEIGRHLGVHHSSIHHMLSGRSVAAPVKREVPCPDLSGEWAI